MSLQEGETKVVEPTLVKDSGSASVPPAPSPRRTAAPDASPKKSRWPTLAYVGFGVGAAGIVAGSVTGYIAFGVGAAGLAVGVVALLTSPAEQPPRERAALRVGLAPTSRGAAASFAVDY